MNQSIGYHFCARLIMRSGGNSGGYGCLLFNSLFTVMDPIREWMEMKQTGYHNQLTMTVFAEVVFRTTKIELLNLYRSNGQ